MNKLILEDETLDCPIIWDTPSQIDENKYNEDSVPDGYFDDEEDIENEVEFNVGFTYDI